MNKHIDWRDILRWVEVSQGLLLIMVVVGVITFYVMAYKHRDKFLRMHVILVSISYLMAICQIVMELLERVGRPVTWRLLCSAITLCVGLAALLALIVHLVINRSMKPKTE